MSTCSRPSWSISVGTGGLGRCRCELGHGVRRTGSAGSASTTPSDWGCRRLTADGLIPVPGSLFPRFPMASNLTQRVVVAAIAIPVALGLIYWGGWAMVLAVSLVAALGARELYDFARRLGVEPLGRTGIALRGRDSGPRVSQRHPRRRARGVGLVSRRALDGGAAHGGPVAPSAERASLRGHRRHRCSEFSIRRVSPLFSFRSGTQATGSFPGPARGWSFSRW